MLFIVYFIIVAGIAVLYYFTRKMLWQLLFSILFTVVFLGFNVLMITNKEFFTGTFFCPDALSVIFVSVLSVTGLTTIINSYIYFHKRDEKPGRRSIYLASLFLLFACMTGAFLSDNINVLWIMAEATTLCISMLIYHERTEESLEATWKYFFVSTIGLSLSFIGILLLNAATNVSGFSTFNFSSLMSGKILVTNDALFMVSFLLIVIGFSVKFGVFPLHTVCIDAHSVAPGPVSAIISTSLMNVGFVSVYRFFRLFYHTSLSSWISHIMIIIGAMTILIATVYMMKVKNYKRLIAYSSIEHMGLVSIGIGIGGIAFFAVILHLIIHAFTKAGLFYQTSQLVSIYKTKQIKEVGGYFNINRSGAVIMLCLFLLIMGLPPSGLFFTKMMILQTIISTGYLWLAILILFLLIFILWSFGRNILGMIFLKESEQIAKERSRISFMENIPQLALLIIALYIGINPPAFLTDIIREANYYLMH